MGKWGFVILAYSVVWAALLGYLFTLKTRLRKAEARLAQLKSESMGRDAT
jgi:CcmD family protein